MGIDVFQYSNGYNYDEFESMCDRFKGIQLPFLKQYDINRLLAAYIFGCSMKRFPIGGKHTFRRFLGGMFLYPVEHEGEGKTAFLFTGDREGRPDYVECIRKVKKQCRDSSLYIMNRTKLTFKITHLFSFFPILIWVFRLNEIVQDFNISFDMAVSLYRAKKQGEYIYKRIEGAGRIVTFCDLWETESVVTQIAKKNHIPTATLQHGNGTDILYGSCSDYYLANSRLSKANCLHAGIPEQKIIITGPMKYAGERFEYKKFICVQNIGVVFDGAQNFENNVEMLQTVHKGLEDRSAHCCIRFHPNNKKEDYQPYILETDVIYDRLDEFEENIDICIVYNSSMYTDMIYKRIPVYRFKNGKVDLFRGLKDGGFWDQNQLTALLKDMDESMNNCLQEQDRLYDCVYGDACGEDSYRKFFEEMFI